MNTSVPTPVGPALIIDPGDGSVRIDGCALVIGAGLARAAAAAGLSRFYRSTRDHNHGYERLSFRGIEFGGRPASFALIFLLGKLTQISFGALSPSAKLEGGWPSREAIDEEVAFMRQELRRQLGRPYESGQERFPWGVAWVAFDAKGFSASAGLRYEP